MVKRPNTTGCEPVIREFESHHSPQFCKTSLIQKSDFYFINNVVNKGTLVYTISMKKFELITFKNNNLQLDVNVSPNEETVWLSKEQIALLFDRDRTVISRHINNIYKEGELDEKSTCAKNAQVQIEGEREVTRKYEFYNLDVIISVGYRVKSKNGIISRNWAINVFKGKKYI